MDLITILTLMMQSLVGIGMMVYYSIACIIKQIVPYKYRCKSIKGETVLITGSGSGLGKSLALKMAKLETRVVLVDIDTKANEQTAKEIKQAGGNAISFTCNLSLKDDIYRVAKEIKDKVGNVTILVNNAGIVTGKKFLDSSDAAIERTMAVNTTAHFWLAKCFMSDMIENDHGHIVSVASMAGLVGCAGLADYCGSKFAAIGFEESMRFELQKLGKKGVQTTLVCPFFINTGMFDGVDTGVIPILEPEYVTDKIMEAILTNQRILFLPKLMYFIYFTKGFLPEQLMFYVASHILKTNHSMDNFVGRIKKD